MTVTQSVGTMGANFGKLFLCKSLPVLEHGKKFYTLAGEWLDKRGKEYW